MYNTTRVKIPEASVHTVLSYANVTRQNGKHVKAIGHNYGVLEEWSCVSTILNKSCVTPGINISTTASQSKRHRRRFNNLTIINRDRDGHIYLQMSNEFCTPPLEKEEEIKLSAWSIVTNLLLRSNKREMTKRLL